MKKIGKIEGKFAGKVDNYYRKISVAAFEPLCSLNVGDIIRFVGGRSTDFTQKIQSMQIDHKKIEKANPGDSIAIKINEPVREGYKIYKL